MATRASTLTGSGFNVRPVLVALWLAAVAVVLTSVLAAALMLGRATPSRTEPGKGPGVPQTDISGPGAPAHQPITVNGKLCAQCR
jgi:hypothetical protein